MKKHPKILLKFGGKKCSSVKAILKANVCALFFDWWFVFLVFYVVDVGVIMIIHFNPVGHSCQANVIHRLLDSQMSCIENFVDEVFLLQHFIWDFINGFFMYSVSVEVAGLDDLFICIVCSPHHNMENSLLLFVGSQVSYLKSKCEPLMVVMIRLAFAIFLLFMYNKEIFIISVGRMGNMGLIFLLLIDNLISEHFFGHK